MPTIQEVHVDQPLSNLAVEYRNLAFIADQACPVVMVDKKSDVYFVYSQKDRFTRPKTMRGPKDKANEVDWSVTTASYTAIDYALAEFLPDSIISNSDSPLTPRAKTVNQLQDLIIMDREIRVASLLTTAGNYGSSYKTTLTGDNQFSSGSTSDPIGVIDTGKAACFFDPNVMIMGRTVYDTLKRHPQLLDHVKGGATTGDPAKVGLQQMAELFEVERILVGRAKYNTANKGQTASFSDIWGDYIVLAYIDPAPQLIGVTAFKTFTWRQMATELGYAVRSWRDESRGGGGEQIEVQTSYDEVCVCSDLAYLISDTIA